MPADQGEGSGHGFLAEYHPLFMAVECARRSRCARSPPSLTRVPRPRPRRYLGLLPNASFIWPPPPPPTAGADAGGFDRMFTGAAGGTSYRARQLLSWDDMETLYCCGVCVRAPARARTATHACRGPSATAPRDTRTSAHPHYSTPQSPARAAAPAPRAKARTLRGRTSRPIASLGSSRGSCAAASRPATPRPCGCGSCTAACRS